MLQQRRGGWWRMESPPLRNCLARKAGSSDLRLSHGRLPGHSATRGPPRPSLGRREDCSCSISLCSSGSLLASPHAFISFPRLARSLIHFLALLLFPSFFHQPHFPPPFQPSLEADFLLSHPFFFLRAQNHTWQSSPPTALPSSSSFPPPSPPAVSFPPPLQFLPPPPPLLFLLSLPHSPQTSLSVSSSPAGDTSESSNRQSQVKVIHEAFTSQGVRGWGWATKVRGEQKLKVGWGECVSVPREPLPAPGALSLPGDFYIRSPASYKHSSWLPASCCIKAPSGTGNV